MLPVVGLDQQPKKVFPLIHSYYIIYTLYIITLTLNKLNKQTNKKTRNTLFGRISSQSSKPGNQNTSNRQNKMMQFTFSVFKRKCLFWVNLTKKYQNCQFKLKFVTQTNSNMQNSMVLFTFSVFKMQLLSKKSICHQNASIVKKINLEFQCYLINLAAVYLQRLEENGFCWFFL